MMTMRYGLIQFFYWVVFGDAIGFSSVYLLECGFTNAQIGVLTAAACAIALVVQPAVAGYAESPRGPSLKAIAGALSGALALLSLSLLLLHALPATGVVYCALIMLLHTLYPLVNALGAACIGQKKRLNFGVARGMGSVGYAALSGCLGAILSRTGARIQPLTICVLSLALCASIFCFPFTKTAKPDSESPERARAGSRRFLVRYRRFALMLLGCVLAYTSHAFLNTFCYQIVVSKGGSSGEMGLVLAVAALAEMPAIFLFSRMLRLCRCDTWIRISGAAFMLKALGSLLAPDMPLYIAVQLLQFLAWGVMTVASVYYATAILDEQDAIKGQAYLGMAFTLSTIIGSVWGGLLLDQAGVHGMLVFSLLVSIAGMAILLLACRGTSQPSGASSRS